MNAQKSSILYLAAVVASIALLFAHNYLPVKKYRLLPNPNGVAFSRDDRSIGGSSHAEFLSEDFSRWSCHLRTGIKEPGCSLGVSMSRDPDDWTTGVDLSGYDAVKIKLIYRGPAKMVRFHLRNFEKGTSSLNDYNSTKFNKIIIRKRDLNTELLIHLSEFQLADWWINQYDIPRKLAQTRFDRVTAFGIDFSSPAPIGEHYLEIEEINFIGEYISQEDWYLGILGIWLVGISIFGIVRLRELHLRHSQDAHRINEMQQYATSLEKESEAYKNLSKTDPLTGTLNRFGLQEIIDVSFEWRRADDEIALIILDLDHFKQINDNLGHDAGDKVLQTLGELLTKSTRSFDTVARWGGEEFILLCPHTPLKAALHIAEKIRIKISELEFSKYPELKITASFGVSTIVQQESFIDVFKRADEALYQAKKEGRNRSVSAQ